MTITIKKYLYTVVVAILVAGGMTSCIDEDNSDCPPPQSDIEILYNIVLDANQDSSFDKELTSIHLGFWTEELLLYRRLMLTRAELPEDMIFRLLLPRDTYSHIAMANCQDDGLGGEHISFVSDINKVAVEPIDFDDDTIHAMSRPIYIGSLEMQIEAFERDKVFTVDLSPMASKMEITVLHPDRVSNMSVCVQGVKSGFRAWSREYMEDPDLVILANLEDFCTRNESTEKLFEFYTFPTAVDDSESQIMNAPAAEDGWKLIFFGEYQGKIIRNAYTIDEQVLRGMVYRNTFEFYVDDDNAATGVEIDVDWKPGSGHDVDI